MTVRWSDPRTGRTERRAFATLHDAHEFAAATRQRFWACEGEDVEHVVRMGYINPRDIPALAQSVALELEPDPEPVVGIGEWNRRQQASRAAEAAEREAREAAGPG